MDERRLMTVQRAEGQEGLGEGESVRMADAVADSPRRPLWLRAAQARSPTSVQVAERCCCAPFNQSEPRLLPSCGSAVPEVLAVLSVYLASGGRDPGDACGASFVGKARERVLLLPTPHWLAHGHMTPPNCKGVWEM